MKWSSNTQNLTERGYSRLWFAKRLKLLGADTAKLLDVYMKQVRSVLELAVPAWHPSLTLGEKEDIERIQKSALQIILGRNYTTYGSALKQLEIDTLEKRRLILCQNFSKKAANHPKHSNWFKINQKNTITRQQEPKYCPVISKTRRFEKSPLSYLTNLLNTYTKPGQ